MHLILAIRFRLTALAACIAVANVHGVSAQTAGPAAVQQSRIQQPVTPQSTGQTGSPATKNTPTETDNDNEKQFAPQPFVHNTEFAPVLGVVDRSGFSIHNPPPQPQVDADPQ